MTNDQPRSQCSSFDLPSGGGKNARTSLVVDRTVDLLTEQRTYLGTQFLGVVRRALRRDFADAAAFFGVPDGPVSYVLASIRPQQTLALCRPGLPYNIPSIRHLLIDANVENRLPAKLIDPDELTGWRRETLELCREHFWLVQSWAQRDLGLAALMADLPTRQAAQAIASMSPALLKTLATATYGAFKLDTAMCMQMAMLFAEADASPDRVAVARAGGRIRAAA